ncbi:proton extrusion protein PcxA [Lyngbya sp. PCC 8106]|uniref:proton extrusion protein PcxA n=1 Tax=Lyngbya sp. (strain PCC 8106) TaxID=313612 RepID=UPI0000EAB1E3|nr:proton extrusion protein PcxA [Lyngbya sp. PCC 8106]EAW39352.1 proton extrusion protein PcxA [Lyngbya sp. PCC 8106]
MKTSTWTQIQYALRRANSWFKDTPDRALDQAYDAALRIKAIEDEHFHGGKITKDSTEYSDRVLSYFDSELKKCLNIIQTRLVVFNTSRSILGWSEPLNSKEMNGSLSSDLSMDDFKLPHHVSLICEKLDFIDSVIGKYSPSKPQPKPQNQPIESTSLVEIKNNSQQSVSLAKSMDEENTPVLNENSDTVKASNSSKDKKKLADELTVGSEMSFLPRSLLRTVGRIRRELNPESEEEVIKNYRKSKVKTIISVRFILLLILVPLLTQQLAKNFVVGPIVDTFVSEEENAPIFMNLDLEEEAYMELHRFKERLEFQNMIGLTPQIEPEEIEEQVQEKAIEIAEEYQSLGNTAIKNIFADLFSIITFGIIIYTNKRELEILKSFLGDLIYGLSDSAKAFIIILLTDMFVGFHSPHGWEVILESISRHFGLPENRDFNFLFIATFPVILDAVFKYWIFRYLNRSSPSAVSTYKTMNE